LPDRLSRAFSYSSSLIDMPKSRDSISRKTRFRTGDPSVGNSAFMRSATERADGDGIRAPQTTPNLT
jgi:hypothetical protein